MPNQQEPEVIHLVDEEDQPNYEEGELVEPPVGEDQHSEEFTRRDRAEQSVPSAAGPVRGPGEGRQHPQRFLPYQPYSFQQSLTSPLLLELLTLRAKHASMTRQLQEASLYVQRVNAWTRAVLRVVHSMPRLTSPTMPPPVGPPNFPL